VLDSCEHLVAAAAAAAEAILRACPGVRILATSREALGVQGEVVWQVPPLAAPDPADPGPVERLADYPAVRLFLDRVAAARPGFVLTEANAPAVAAICARLDGLPLAIELAAARARVLSVEQIAARLGDRFRLLSAGARTAPPQQQTLRATMDWSHDLLAPTERVLFRRLGVFAGGCTLEAAEAVCAPAAPDDAPAPPGAPTLEPLDLFDVLDGVQALVDKSLLTREEGENGSGSGAPRLGMLQTVRDYALERLEAAGETGPVRARHLAHYLSLALEAEPRVRGADQLAWLARLERDHDNLRTALEWSAAAPAGRLAAGDGLRLAAALGWFWYLRGYRAEGRSRLETLLARTPEAPPAVRSRALGVEAHLAFWTGASEDALRLSEAAEALARDSAGDPLTLAWALLYRAVVQRPGADRQGLESWWREALDGFSAAGEAWGTALARSWLGQLAYERGETAQAARDAQESLAEFRRLGDRWGMALALARSANVAELRGDLEAAEAFWREQQALATALGHRGAVAGGLARLAALRLRRGDAAGAAPLFERSVALYRLLGERRTTAWPLAQLALLEARERGDFTRAWALLREGLRVWQEHGDLPGLARGLLLGAAVAALQGPPDRAARLAGAAQRALAEHGVGLDPVARATIERQLAALEAELADESARTAWEAGRALSTDQALTELGALRSRAR
jgi:predicted ATPase